MASSTARILVSRGRPTRNFAGMCGSISAHSSSVVSLAYRSPSRRYLMRVISVHDILGSPSLLTPRQNHKRLESLNSIFGQPLRTRRRRLGNNGRDAVIMSHAEIVEG